MDQNGLHQSIDILQQRCSGNGNTDPTAVCGLMTLSRSRFVFSSDTILVSDFQILYIQSFQYPFWTPEALLTTV